LRATERRISHPDVLLLRYGLFAGLIVVGLAGSGCATGRLRLPTGPGIPRSDFAALFEEATTGCRSVRTITAELSLSGRAGAQRLRGRVQVGLSAPADVRLEAPAPFGAPVFILAATNERGTLLLPRDSRVVRDASVRDVLAALAGIELGAADLRALVSGCVIPEPRAQAGREFPADWIAVDLQDAAVVWLHRQNGRWRVAAGEHAGLRVEYANGTTAAADLPRQLRVSATAASDTAQLDLRISLSQVEINVPLGPEAFTLTVPSGTTPMTLDELRARGALSRP
jgi:hypothetical protein